MNLSSKNIRSHLKKLNLKKGDNICCHANLFTFGFSDLKICKYLKIYLISYYCTYIKCCKMCSFSPYYIQSLYYIL